MQIYVYVHNILQGGPSNSRERPRTIRSKFSPFWRNWVDSGVDGDHRRRAEGEATEVSESEWMEQQQRWKRGWIKEGKTEGAAKAAAA
jgi:hypothetical protein